jgi:hypothetical protein
VSLGVRTAPHHPGFSPAAIAGEAEQGGLRRLVGVAFGRASDHDATRPAG